MPQPHHVRACLLPPPRQFTSPALVPAVWASRRCWQPCRPLTSLKSCYVSDTVCVWECMRIADPTAPLHMAHGTCRHGSTRCCLPSLRAACSVRTSWQWLCSGCTKGLRWAKLAPSSLWRMVGTAAHLTTPALPTGHHWPMDGAWLFLRL